MINIKFCKKCKRAFDIGTEFDLCPFCRHEELKLKKEVHKKEVEYNGKI